MLLYRMTRGEPGSIVANGVANRRVRWQPPRLIPLYELVYTRRGKQNIGGAMIYRSEESGFGHG